MENNVLNCSLTYDTGRNELGFYEGNNWHGWNDYYYPIYPTIYPTYIHQEDKVSKAFKIIQKLIEKGIVKEINVKDFIALTNEIAGII